MLGNLPLTPAFPHLTPDPSPKREGKTCFTIAGNYLLMFRVIYNPNLVFK
jgi:hypothetical protein